MDSSGFSATVCYLLRATDTPNRRPKLHCLKSPGYSNCLFSHTKYSARTFGLVWCRKTKHLMSIHEAVTGANFFDRCKLLQNVYEMASDHRPTEVNEICTPPKILRLVIICFRSWLDLRYRSGHPYNGSGHPYINRKYDEKD